MEGAITVEGRSYELAPIVRIAKDAGAVIMKIYNDPTGEWNVDKKADNSPVTKADLAANDVICKALLALHPDVPIMSEETKAEAYATRAKWGAYWCVDPLDGTKEFLKRNGEFTVNIALVSDGRPVLGVVYAPALDKCYWGAKGVGAWQDGVRLHAAEFSEKDAGLVLVCSRSHRDERTTAFLERYTEPKTKSMGSSLKFMLVASGEAHLYPRLAPTMEWDTAASQIIVEEAGGVVLREPDAKPMMYNKEDLLNPYFIVHGARRV